MINILASLTSPYDFNMLLNGKMMGIKKSINPGLLCFDEAPNSPDQLTRKCRVAS